MEKSLIYVMSIVRSAPGNRIKQEELTDKVSKDISQNKGAYIGYSESYRMTRFNKDISELVSKGFLCRTDATLEMSYEAVNFFDKLPKPFEGVKETIYTRLYELLNTGQALKLDILRLMIEEVGEVRDGLKSLMWSEKAVESALTQLSMDDVISLERKPKLKTEEVKIEVKKFFDSCRDNVLGLSLDKRNESERLEITLPKYRRSTSFSTSPINLATLLIDFASELRTRKVEMLSTEFNSLRLAFNQKLYEITYREEELFDLPHFPTDRALFLSDRIHPVFIKNFCGEYNAENRKICAVYNLKASEKFNVTGDTVFDFFEIFLQNRFGLSFTLPNQVFEKTEDIIKELSYALRKEKEESAKKKVIEEGFLYTQVNVPWTLGNKIQELLKKSKSIIRISNPYADNSTFNLLQSTPQVKILMLVTQDDRLGRKVSEGILSKKEVQKTLEKKRIEIKRIQGLHARFLIIDDEEIIFLSSDLQTGALQSKYQYGSWTNSSEIVKACVNYFDSMWNDAESYDLIKEIEEKSKG